MEPSPGTGTLLYVGDILQVRLNLEGDESSAASAFLRTDLNTSPEKHQHVIERVEQDVPPFSAGWHDVPMKRAGKNAFEINLIAYQPGYYEFKTFVKVGDATHWQSGENASVTVHPLKWRGRNSIYCAFPRQFGPYKNLEQAADRLETDEVLSLEDNDFTVIPPSGKLSDLSEVLPFLFNELGIRIIHLLPMQETPTHYARMGRYGSPYAARDLRNINQAYCSFQTDGTPDLQFREFCARVHAFGGEVFLDLAVNHLGWHTDLLNSHPDWFVRKPDGKFVSPGAWDVTWEDLVELNFEQKAVWKYLAESLLLWCERGVDGFRCDAGYKIPTHVWQYVTAKVQQIFPDTLFLLEGLGGSWEATEQILKTGGMQWAYSELFQQQGTESLYSYLEHLDMTCSEIGILANYAETHDNNRLALKGKEHVQQRLALSALSSTAGAFGFANGVEWLATEKIDVHGSSGLHWGNPDNIVPWIRRLNDLLQCHPIFHGVARIIPIGQLPPDVLAFFRRRGDESLLVVMNLHPKESRDVVLPAEALEAEESQFQCLLTGKEVDLGEQLELAPQSVLCFDLKQAGGRLSPEETTNGIRQEEEALRLRGLIGELWGETFDLDGFDRLLDAVRDRGWKFFLAAASKGRPENAVRMAEEVRNIAEVDIFLGVSEWNFSRADRVHVMSTAQFLYLEEEVPFRAELVFPDHALDLYTFQDFNNGHYVAFARVPEGPLTIEQSQLERPAATGDEAPRWVQTHGQAIAFDSEPQPVSLCFRPGEIQPDHHFLLSNDSGSYTFLPISPRTVTSKYDAFLAANFHPTAPDERVVLIKRVRMWLFTPMGTYPLSQEYLSEFRRWPWPTWIYEYRLPEGALRIQEQVRLSPEEHVAWSILSWDAPVLSDVALILRPDVELRSHHRETKAFLLNEAEFAGQYQKLNDKQGIGFHRQVSDELWMVVHVNSGEFHSEPEWSYNIRHPHEASRGQESVCDAFSPGYFSIPLDTLKNSASLVCAVVGPGQAHHGFRSSFPGDGEFAEPQNVQHILARACTQFLVRRDQLRTVLAGFPWFLDWGRDTFIAARGYLAEGFVNEVRDLVFAFARLEREGTLPNALSAESDANRDTSDAPLWFIRVVEELCDEMGWEKLLAEAGKSDVPLEGCVRSICDHYLHGTPNGIYCDPESGLVYSPPHFTWMDTNYPAATPREGYPIEIQALWIRALQFASRILGRSDFAEVAGRASKSLVQLFWMDGVGHFADCLPARTGTSAVHAGRDESLRPNQLYAVALELIDIERAQKSVIQTGRNLLIPSGLRTVANRPLSAWPWVDHAEPPNGFDPMNPYAGRYEGDEDTSRKLSYHNGTVWAQLLPLWVDALLFAFPNDVRAVRLGQSFMRTYEEELRRGCVGQISEIFDGDAPHTSRGCAAQAWAVTEVLRVNRRLSTALQEIRLG